MEVLVKLSDHKKHKETQKILRQRKLRNSDGQGIGRQAHKRKHRLSNSNQNSLSKS